MTDASPMFSVLVPTYNHAAYVGAALDSLRAQTCTDWEAVVVNDGSTDGTVPIIEEYVRRDPRIRVYHKANGGCASALNVGLSHARGVWILWLSSDDSFCPEKLAQHQAAFAQHPSTRVFHTHFELVDYATGIVTAPDHWRRQPETRWQILEMLESTYIQTISICVHRACFEQIGCFDESLRYSQDYDIFLRLLASFPAEFMDQRTCRIGRHAGQTTNTQGALNLFIDDGKAAILFLNRTRFEALFPLMDLNDSRQAERALDHALDAAANPHAFLYKAGVHPGLVLRIMEWVWAEDRGPDGRRWRHMFRERARAAAHVHAGTPLGYLWRAAHAASVAWRGPVAFRPAPVADVLAAQAHWSRGRDDAAWETYAGYLARFEGRRLPMGGDRPVSRRAGECLFMTPENTSLESGEVYGALRMTLTMAAYLQGQGQAVWLLGRGSAPLMYCGGLPAVAAGDDWTLQRVLAAWGRTDALVCVGRSDPLLNGRARRRIVYHHTTHAIPGGLTPAQLNRIGASVFAVSDYSAAQMVSSGLRADRVVRVINTYDTETFNPGAMAPRNPRSLVFAGNIAAYKGVDIVLQAFRQVRNVAPDATLTVCGRVPGPWECCRDGGLLEKGWTDASGALNCGAITRDVPGVAFMGHCEADVLARVLHAHSLLLLSSRYGENFPLIALEAQACGCLPVMPRHLALPETVRAGVTGFLYEPNTPEALSEAILTLWRSEQPTDAQRAEASAWVALTFDAESAGRMFADAVERCAPVTSAQAAASVILRLRRRLAGCMSRVSRRLADT